MVYYTMLIFPRWSSVGIPHVLPVGAVVPMLTFCGAYQVFLERSKARLGFCQARLLDGCWKFNWLCIFFIM